MVAELCSRKGKEGEGTPDSETVTAELNQTHGLQQLESALVYIVGLFIEHCIILAQHSTLLLFSMTMI